MEDAHEEDIHDVESSNHAESEHDAKFEKCEGKSNPNFCREIQTRFPVEKQTTKKWDLTRVEECDKANDTRKDDKAGFQRG